jgi:hypothetical protein
MNLHTTSSLDLRQELLKRAQFKAAKRTPFSAIKTEENRTFSKEIGATDLLAGCIAQGEWREFGTDLDSFLHIKSCDDVVFCFDDCAALFYGAGLDPVGRMES